jgi:hypothetical protein
MATVKNPAPHEHEVFETLSALYERISNYYHPRDTEVSCTVGELGAFVEHIHERLLENYDVMPKAKAKTA